MSYIRHLFTFLIIALNSVAIAAHLPDDIEAGDSINDIQLPLTKKSAAELIRLESKGKILSVAQKMRNNKTLFLIKVLHNNGKIKIYSLDAETGHSPN